MLVFQRIHRSEIEAFFCEAYGYKTIVNITGTYIYSLRKKGHGFIYLSPNLNYWRPTLFFWMWMDKQLLNDPFPLAWAKFLLHTNINRVINTQSKNK